MCSSMEDKNPHPKKSRKQNSQVPTHHANPSKLLNRFLCKAIIVTISLLILPLFPSIFPELVNQTFHPGSWELLQLIFVGIVVSYGLFSKKNEEVVDKEQQHNSIFDNANSYVTRLLQISSVFDDEAENQNPSVSDEKIQTWSSQYHRGQPIVMVANKSLDLDEQNGSVSSRIDEKPLLLPVRSLKSRASESNSVEITGESELKNMGTKRFSARPRKSVNGDDVRISPQKKEENLGEKIVYPSPIPWRSRSGRMEMKLEEDNLPPMEDPEIQYRRCHSSKSFKLNSTASSPPLRSFSEKNQPTFSYVPSERKEESSVGNGLRRKIQPRASSPPPAPPPPPPSFLHKPSNLKSKSGLSRKTDFFDIELEQSQFQSESPPRKSKSGSEQSLKAQSDVQLQVRSVRTIRPTSKDYDGDSRAREVEGNYMEKQGLMSKLMQERLPDFKKESLMEYTGEEKKGSLLAENNEGSKSEGEEEYLLGSLGSHGSAGEKDEAPNGNAPNDDGPDVDKKADEFIAKFREQIRLQRIDSIRRSTEQHSRNHSR